MAARKPHRAAGTSGQAPSWANSVFGKGRVISVLFTALVRDVVERHAVSNPTALRWMVRHLLGNAAGAFSVQRFYHALHSQGQKALRIYARKDCAGCPLAGKCLDPKATRGRTIRRDGHEPARERMHAKMQSESGKRTKHRRMRIGDSPNAAPFPCGGFAVPHFAEP